VAFSFAASFSEESPILFDRSKSGLCLVVYQIFLIKDFVSIEATEDLK